MEAQARDWLQAVVGEPFPDGTFHEALKDGTYLVKVMNVLNPSRKIKINTNKMAFKMVSEFEQTKESSNIVYNYVCIIILCRLVFEVAPICPTVDEKLLYNFIYLYIYIIIIIYLAPHLVYNSCVQLNKIN